MDPYNFKLLVPEAEWVAVPPQLTRFRSGHDARIQAESGDANATTVDISLESNDPMNCGQVMASISFNVSARARVEAP